MKAVGKTSEGFLIPEAPFFCFVFLQVGGGVQSKTNTVYPTQESDLTSQSPTVKTSQSPPKLVCLGKSSGPLQNNRLGLHLHVLLSSCTVGQEAN